MTSKCKTKARLLLGSAGLAIAISAIYLPGQAFAQAFQASPSVSQGTVNIDRSVVGQDTITVTGLDAVIDWRPDLDNAGDALTFLPAGNTGIFQGDPGATNFAVINRVLPDSGGNIVVMDGNVISQVRDFSGIPTGPGGLVMFYSPTGILVGSTASFDIGSLVLTSLAPDITSLSAYASGTGSMNFVAAQADSPPVQINFGATITGSEEGSSFLVAAPSIFMGGIADINGSTAYVAGENVTLSYANGLFDIVINTGSNAANAITHAGTTTGPASTGAGDNHVIYGVMQTQQTPGSALFQGNLGFQPAVDATIENGTIILSANYNVSGTTVQNDFTNDSVLNPQPVQLIVEGADISSAIELHSSDLARISAVDVFASIAGDVFVYGRNDAEIYASDFGSLQIVGNVVVSADDIGSPLFGDGDPASLDAIAGNASLGADVGGSVDVTGNLIITANATPGEDSVSLIAGSATAGFAGLYALDGLVTIDGSVALHADALDFLPSSSLGAAGDATGGTVQVDLVNAATLSITGSLNATADAFAQALSGATGIAPAATAGSVRLYALNATVNPGTMLIDGNVSLQAEATGSTTSGATAGTATGGSTSISATNDVTVTIGGNATQSAFALGATTSGAVGGAATGGSTEIGVDNGAVLAIGGNAELYSSADGGSAQGGSSSLLVQGATALDLAQLIMEALGTSVAGGDASGGVIDIQLAGGSGALTVTSASLDASAQGGTSNTSGTFDILADGGNASFGDLQALAANGGGGIDTTLSSIGASNGSINVSSFLFADVAGDLRVETSLGGMILGGSDALNLTASVNLVANGLVTIAGDDDATPSFLAQFMTITSNDLAVLAGARFGAPTLSLYSTNATDGTILGGTTAGAGYALTQAEFERIEGDDLFIQAADTAGAVPHSLELRDLTIPGSLASGFSSVAIDSLGNFGVVGDVLFSDAGPSDTLFLGAAQEMEFVLPNASVMMMDAGGSLAGSLSLFAPQIFAGDSATLATINADPDDPGLATLLGDDSANTLLSNYIGADSVDISGGSHILMQNSGAAGTMAGIIVGPGGLMIRQSPDFSSPSTMRTVAYGMQELGSGGTVTNDAWFALVDFGPDPAAEFTPEATFNDCVIVTGQCPVVPAPPPPPPPPPPSPPEVEPPITTIDYTELPPTETNLEPTEQPFLLEYFGSFFPSLLNPPPTGNRGLVTDPVTSGGDSASYSQNDGSGS